MRRWLPFYFLSRALGKPEQHRDDYLIAMCSSNPALYNLEHIVLFPECPVMFRLVKLIPAW